MKQVCKIQKSGLKDTKVFKKKTVNLNFKKTTKEEIKLEIKRVKCGRVFLTELAKKNRISFFFFLSRGGILKPLSLWTDSIGIYEVFKWGRTKQQNREASALRSGGQESHLEPTPVWASLMWFDGRAANSYFSWGISLATCQEPPSLQSSSEVLGGGKQILIDSKTLIT